MIKVELHNPITKKSLLIFNINCSNKRNLKEIHQALIGEIKYNKAVFDFEGLVYK